MDNYCRLWISIGIVIRLGWKGVMKMAKGELTEMQEKFCIEYAELGNATASAINAGYSKNSAGVQGSRLMKDVKIQRRIAEVRAEMGIEINTKRDNVLEMLYNIAEDGKGEPQHRLKALEMISKIEGYYKDMPDIKVENNMNFEPEKMTDEELERKLDELEIEMATMDVNY